MSSGRRVWDPRNTRRDTNAGQNLEKYDPAHSSLISGIYTLSVQIPPYIFNPDYPVNPKTLGDKIRVARLDAGLQIKDLAAQLGITQDTLINWELRGVMPSKQFKPKVEEFIGNGTGNIIQNL